LSGIVGILNRNGAPAERALLRALVQFLSYSGPDAREVWSDGPIGFGHTLLRTTRESLNERQPASLEGHLWIAADARLDCRAELEAELADGGRKYRRPAPDSELILQAYALWGERCVDHLRGDFSFGIWDAHRRMLFCARDHFGVKPFYYAELGDLFVFSNTLTCIRLHPDVSEDLSEAAIADFLLFGLNCDNSTTTFRDIRRLPPAHFLIVSPEGVRIERFWSAPTGGRIRYRHADDYVEHLQVLLEAAVVDRLRIDRVGILLSGGIDSGSIAATARELMGQPKGACDLRAYTAVYRASNLDQDAEHARNAAKFLRIPIHCSPMDGLEPFERWDDPEWTLPEPVDDPFFAGLFDQFRLIAADCRVVLSGEGSDNLMHFQMLPYMQDMMRNGEWGRFLAEVPHYLWVRPSLWPGVRRRIKGLFGKDSKAPVYPKWFAPEFARRMDLEERWREWSELRVTAGHPILPKAHASLSIPQWTHFFEHENPAVTHFPVEVRYPFLDLRIVDYLLALPPFPWFFEKMILREAMAGRLPESVRLRPKTPMAVDPLAERLKNRETEWMSDPHWNEEMGQYICLPSLVRPNGERKLRSADSNIRPLCLNFWLQSARRVRYNLRAEARNG
jgi:asparagine synthase (glutamine-hydrolysing)